MKNFFRKLQASFQPDKINHFAISYILMHIINLFLPLWVTIVAVALIGIIKEIYIDEKPDKGDLIADAVGILFYTAVVLSYMYYFQ